MDWTKAKTILIVALLLTNLFLVFTYAFNKAEDQADKEEVLLSVLQKNNIELKTEIPQKPGKLPVLSVEYSGTQNSAMESTLREREFVLEGNMVREEELIRVADMFLAESGMTGDNILLDKVELKQGIWMVSYKNQVEDISVEESYIRCYFKNGALYFAESYWLEPKSFSQKKRDVISASEALVIFMSQLPTKEEKIIIEAIELVYWLDSASFNGERWVTDTALPAWKIMYNGDQKKHIYAYDQ